MSVVPLEWLRFPVAAAGGLVVSGGEVSVGV